MRRDSQNISRLCRLPVSASAVGHVGQRLGDRLPAQPRPGLRGRLEHVLDQIPGELTVAAGPHARMAEQPPVMSREELVQFGDMASRNPGLLAIVHAAAPPVSACARIRPAQARARPARSSLSTS
jgi:hypothetical protein